MTITKESKKIRNGHIFNDNINYTSFNFIHCPRINNERYPTLRKFSIFNV